jgi:hypothetical protein
MAPVELKILPRKGQRGATAHTQEVSKARSRVRHDAAVMSDQEVSQHRHRQKFRYQSHYQSRLAGLPWDTDSSSEMAPEHGFEP